MPVGTLATVKGSHQRDLKNVINSDIILGIHIICISDLEQKLLIEQGVFINLWVGIDQY